MAFRRPPCPTLGGTRHVLGQRGIDFWLRSQTKKIKIRGERRRTVWRLCRLFGTSHRPSCFEKMLWDTITMARAAKPKRIRIHDCQTSNSPATNHLLVASCWKFGLPRLHVKNNKKRLRNRNATQTNEKKQASLVCFVDAPLRFRACLRRSLLGHAALRSSNWYGSRLAPRR